MAQTDTVLHLLDRLCRIESHHVKDGDAITQGEDEMAKAVAELLRDIPWLTVEVTQVAHGIWNVLASDGPREKTKLLIAGHLDTVRPSVGWTKALGTFEHDRYYNLGAVDTKGGIAAVLDAIKAAGPTSGVSYLFYGDEEINFTGFDRFLADSPEVKPQHALSVCGGAGKAVTGCRGCIELEFEIDGQSGHASRQHAGVNAIEAMIFVMDGLKRLVDTANRHRLTAAPTSFNLAAIHGGSRREGGGRIPPVVETANAIADVAWALIDVRPGGPEITSRSLRHAAHTLLEYGFNAGRPHDKRAALRTKVNFDRGAYHCTEAQIAPLFAAFAGVHGGQRESAEGYGYIDIAELASTRGTALMCLSPLGGNAHSPDEWVSVESVIAYRDATVQLLTQYKP